MNPSNSRRALVAAFLAVPLAASAVWAQSDGEDRIGAAFAAMKATNSGNAQMPKADSSGANPSIRLPDGWKGGQTTSYEWNKNLSVPTWVVSCKEGSSDCQEKAPLYWNPKENGGAGAWVKYWDYQTSTKPGFAAPTGLPKAGRHGNSDFTPQVSEGARKLLAGWGGQGIAGNYLITAADEVDLNAGGKTMSAALDVDPSDPHKLNIIMTKQDGSTRNVSMKDGSVMK